MEIRLDGKTAIVTGASRGIGRAVAVEFARSGASVCVNYRVNESAAEETANQIEKLGAEFIVHQADVTDFDEVKKMVETTARELGPPLILVNNAGMVKDSLMAFMNLDQWHDVLDANLTGAFHCMKLIARQMARSRWGRIINISSVAGLTGDAQRTNYSAAKAGLLGLTKAAARELARSGITVNAIAPGMIETDLISDLDNRRGEQLLQSIPMGRFGQPTDVAAMALFLASEASSYITGQVFGVDGGLRM